MTRAFIAIRPPDAVLDAIETRTHALDLPSGGRRTTRDQWHLTLQFLGNGADVDEVTDALSSLELPAATARLSGAGTLPPERKSRYLVLFLREGEAWVKELRADIAARLAPLGYEPDERAFTPHLTVARFRDRSDLRDLCRVAGQDPVGDPWLVSAVTVYESRLLPSGAEYVARAEIPLGA
jgi:2'-5' RNA ligase